MCFRAGFACQPSQSPFSPYDWSDRQHLFLYVPAYFSYKISLIRKTHRNPSILSLKTKDDRLYHSTLISQSWLESTTKTKTL